MTDFSPLDSALYESTPEKIAASLRYLRKADAVMAALMPLSAAKPAPVAVPEVDWRALYRFQTAMRYMDADAKLTREKAYAMADQDVAGLLAAAKGDKP